MTTEPHRIPGVSGTYDQKDKECSLANFYAMYFPGMRAAAREWGYALAVHGSMKRDLDCVAIPWVEDAAPEEQLVEALRKEVGGLLYEHDPTNKPHGRKAWTIRLSDGFIDLCVMPRVAP